MSKRLSHASASDSLHLGSVKGEGKARDDCERLIKTVIGSGWSEENGEDKGVKIELKRGRGILTFYRVMMKKGFLEFHREYEREHVNI